MSRRSIYIYYCRSSAAIVTCHYWHGDSYCSCLPCCPVPPMLWVVAVLGKALFGMVTPHSLPERNCIKSYMSTAWGYNKAFHAQGFAVSQCTTSNKHVKVCTKPPPDNNKPCLLAQAYVPSLLSAHSCLGLCLPHGWLCRHVAQVWPACQAWLGLPATGFNATQCQAAHVPAWLSGVWVVPTQAATACCLGQAVWNKENNAVMPALLEIRSLQHVIPVVKSILLFCLFVGCPGMSAQACHACRIVSSLLSWLLWVGIIIIRHVAWQNNVTWLEHH